MVNVIGIQYKVKEVDTQREMVNMNSVAECNYSKKTITLALGDTEGMGYSDEWIEDSFLHELAHVFLYETGQSDINDERMAEVLAKFARFAKVVSYKEVIDG